MRLTELIERLQKIEPNASDAHIARVALLLTKQHVDLSTLSDVAYLEERYRELEWTMHSLHDQQAAVAEELDLLAESSPAEFAPSHLWTLVRGIKIQSRILDFYLD